MKENSKRFFKNDGEKFETKRHKLLFHNIWKRRGVKTAQVVFHGASHFYSPADSVERYLKDSFKEIEHISPCKKIEKQKTVQCDSNDISFKRQLAVSILRKKYPNFNGFFHHLFNVSKRAALSEKQCNTVITANESGSFFKRIINE